VSNFQTMWVDSRLLKCETNTALQLHTQNNYVIPPVCCQNLYVIVGNMLCDWPPCYRSSHKRLGAGKWTCAYPDDPHNVSLLLQIRRTALDEGPTAFQPQVCHDCLQRDYGCLQHLDGIRGAYLWSCLSPSEVYLIYNYTNCHSLGTTIHLIYKLKYFPCLTVEAALSILGFIRRVAKSDY